MRDFQGIFYVCVWVFFVTRAAAQVGSGAYRSGYYEEMVYSSTLEKYVEVETVEQTSKIVFAEGYIAFKKGNSDWRQNAWEFKKHDKEDNADVYKDERGQVAIVDYENSKLVYLYDYDQHTEYYKSMTVYCALKKDEAVAEEFEEERAAGRKGQGEKFRRDYTLVSILDRETDKWSEWDKGLNTFIINTNESGDILHIMASGKQVLYRRTSGAEDGTTSSGEKYQTVYAVDENGGSFLFQIFDDPEIGLKMIYGDYMIQFSDR